MFKGLVSLFKAAIRFFVDGVKALLGSQPAPDSETMQVLSTKGSSAFIAVAAVLLLLIPTPAVRGWSDALFRVAYQLWHASSGRMLYA